MSSPESIVNQNPLISESMGHYSDNEGRLIYFWRGGDKVDLTFADQLDGAVSKIVNIRDNVFLMTSNHSLYYGEVSNKSTNDKESSTATLVLKRSNELSVVDLAANSSHLFIVTSDGHVQQIHPQDLTITDTIIIKENIKFCSHGCKKDNDIKIRAIAVNDNSALFLTEAGQLWANGYQPQINIESQEPQKVLFFDDRIISEVVCGSNFYIALVKRMSRLKKTDADSPSHTDEVFVKTCTQCLNNVMPSSMSVASSDTGPMLVNPKQLSKTNSTNSISVASSTSKEDVFCSTDEKLITNSVNFIAMNDISTDEVSESEKEAKKNVISLNTEAAKQFFTRQLSWVSSYSSIKDEFQMDTIDNPTSLIKQNVSNMANLVYEGVKTVGDKVVTLSRHVSGSSDTNDVRDDISDKFEELEIEELKKSAGSLVNGLRNEEFPWSSSRASSERELVQDRLSDKINFLVQNGINTLSSELWAWGDINYEQLSVEGMIDTTKPCEVTILNNCVIIKLACGAFHTVALTLDGRVFTWGNNNFTQVSYGSQSEISAYKRAIDIAAGTDHSLIMIDKKIFLIEKNGSSETMLNLKIPEMKNYTLKNIFCSDIFSCCTIINESDSAISTILLEEQIFLDEMLCTHKNLIIPFQKASGILHECNIYDALCCWYTELLNINVLNVKSLWNYYNRDTEACDVVIVAMVDDFIGIYRYYLNTICDIIALRGFTPIAVLLQDLEVLSTTFKDKIKCNSSNLTNESIISFSLQNPLQHLNRYLNIVTNLIKINKGNTGREQLLQALQKWEIISKDQVKRLHQAESTKVFWEGCGKAVEQFRSPDNRMIRESRSHHISLLGSSRFSSHWFILLTDVFIHVTGTNCRVYTLPLLWIELLPDSDTIKNAISFTSPEDNFILYTQSATDRSEWYHAVQTAIKNSLHRSTNHMPPQIRNGSFSFIKHSVYKDASYTGQWLNGKLHGSGKLEWADNRMYIGQFNKGAIHGTGRMEMPTQGVYEGQWKDGQQNGFGVMNYINGDIYEGYFKDGLPHGHGMKKEGHFMASVASMYIGEWSFGVKQGYGVMDDIKTGEKYLGSWNNNTKHGNGLIVTLDGIYYEGVFVQDVFMGHGIMVFEDETHYEGEFKAVGVFGGKGILTFCNEEILEGNFSGAWNEGIKVSATLHLSNKIHKNKTCKEPPSFGKLCAPPDQKWKAIFSQLYQQLGLPEVSSTSNSKSVRTRKSESERLWQNVAIIISKSQRCQQKRQCFSSNNNSCLNSSLSQINGKDVDTINDQLQKILYFDNEKLSLSAYEQINKYLRRAFESPHHPLGTLLNELASVYTATYGGVRVHPLLLEHAVAELRSITRRIYEVVTLFFPALPKAPDQCILKSEEDECNEERVISAAAILHPLLLPRVYSALFVLYALHNKKTDDAYWERLIKWNKQPNNTLLAFLGTDEKFWKNFDTSENNTFLIEAIETLQQLKTTFSAVEKLIVIKNTHHQIEQAIQKRFLENYKLPADELIPMLYFVVIRASVLQLGSEIHFIKDFMESYLMNGPIGYAFTTIMGIYDHILKEKISLDD